MPRSEKSQTITRVTIPTAKSNYEVSPAFMHVCVYARICIYISTPRVAFNIRMHLGSIPRDTTLDNNLREIRNTADVSGG